MELGEKLKELRESKKMEQIEVASKMKSSVSTISGYENGYRTPPLEKLIKLAKLYEVSLDYLVGFENKIDLSKNDLQKMLNDLKTQLDKSNKELNSKIKEIEKYINNTK